MNDPEDVRQLVRDHLGDPDSQWTVGTFGAIAEFMRDQSEPVVIVDEPRQMSVSTSRGGISFGSLDGVKAFASESATGSMWGHRVSLCLRDAQCETSRRTVLTEMGADDAAIRPEDRAAILFDMGLGTRQVDVCIRVSDPTLCGLLRDHLGRSLFEPGNPVMSAVIAAGPHRVFIARFARCEVYQGIPTAEGRSPPGPHTHVLPELIKSGRTHAATEPVPEGFVPCAHLIPAHPVRDAMGYARPYNAAAHGCFEDLLSRFGCPSLQDVKNAARRGVSAAQDPHTFAAPLGRFERHALRVALRQLAAGGPSSPSLEAWRSVFDPRDAAE